MASHTIKDEHEHTDLETGERRWVLHCTCGQTFSAPFRMGLTPRRTAAAKHRRHAQDMETLTIASGRNGGSR